MFLEEVASPRDEITKPRAFKTFRRPIHLRVGATPRLMFESLASAFQKLPIKACIMGEDEIGTFDKRSHLCPINRLASHHLIRDARDLGDLGRDRIFGLLQSVERFFHLADAPLALIGERHHRKFDNLVTRSIKPGRFNIDKKRGADGA